MHKINICFVISKSDIRDLMKTVNNSRFVEPPKIRGIAIKFIKASGECPSQPFLPLVSPLKRLFEVINFILPSIQLLTCK